jgi:hypothetical protein
MLDCCLVGFIYKAGPSGLLFKKQSLTDCGSAFEMASSSEGQPLKTHTVA